VTPRPLAAPGTCTRPGAVSWREAVVEGLDGGRTVQSVGDGGRCRPELRGIRRQRRRPPRPHGTPPQGGEPHGEPHHAEARAEDADAEPSGPCVGSGRGDRPAGCPDGVEDHVRRHGTAAGVGQGVGDHALAGDVHGLDGAVEQDEAEHEQTERLLEERDRQPRQRHRRERDAGRDVREAGIGQAAGTHGCRGAGEADEAEEADRAVRQRQRRGRESQGERRPEHVERGEDQRRQRRPRSQHRILSEQRRHRRDESPVRHRRLAAIACWQQPLEPPPDHRCDHGGDAVHRSPAPHVAHDARERSRREYADDDTACDNSDHSPSIAGMGERGCEGDEHLGHHGEDAEGGHPGQQHRGRWRGGDGDERHRRQLGLHHEEPPAVDHVPERDEEQEAEGVPDLCHGHEQPGVPRADRERAGQLVEQRLGDRDVADRHAGGQSEQAQLRRRDHASRPRKSRTSVAMSCPLVSNA
jgi:hypothetical protein